jgi:hypothetical protein
MYVLLTHTLLKNKLFYPMKFSIVIYNIKSEVVVKDLLNISILQQLHFKLAPFTGF